MYPIMHWAGGVSQHALGVSAWVCVCVSKGVCPGGLSAQGVCLPEGCLPGGSALGVCIPACNGADTPPP